MDNKINRLLVIEDDIEVCNVLLSGLSQTEYEIVVAEDGEKALELFYQFKPQVLILDLGLPKIDGIKILEKLESKINQEYSIIVLTHDQDKMLTCYNLGVQAFLGKPFDIIALQGLVKHAFALMQFSFQLRSEVQAKEEAYHQLELQHKILRATFEGMAEGAITIDHSFRIQMISSKACHILNILEQNSIGKPVIEILGVPLAGPNGELMDVIKQNKMTSDIQAPILSPSGAVIPVNISVIQLNISQSSKGWLLLFRDIREEERLIRKKAGSFTFGPMISCDPKMKSIFDLIESVASSNSTVFVKGESGTGKELVSREIHTRSWRAQGPFHAVNCAAISPNLLESEFFGHEKGAFTGAHNQKKGRFELAHRGTLFLDEITEIPLELQGKLLRALEESKFERVGGTESVKVDIRVIAATNRDVGQMVDRKEFREDLYYRLHVIPIELPPLRERANDIPILVSSFIQQFNKRDSRQVKSIVAEALQSLQDYAWPGNIRELFHAIEYAFVTSKGSIIRQSHLQETIRKQNRSSDPFTSVQNEKELVLEALRKVNFHKGKAASLLGIAPSTLYRKRKKFEI